MGRAGVVIPAGGMGIRVGNTLPKQFLKLHDHTIIECTVTAFESSPLVDEIVIAAPVDHISRINKILKSAKFKKVSAVVVGGMERQDSVWNGLNAFRAAPDIVLVHDAVRPFVSRRLIERVIDAARKSGAAVVGQPMQDTLKKEGKAGYYTETLDRSGLWTVQTPQGFDYGILLNAHKLAQEVRFKGTDESSLLERIGIPVKIVAGDPANLKITTREDLALARDIARTRKM